MTSAKIWLQPSHSQRVSFCSSWQEVELPATESRPYNRKSYYNFETGEITDDLPVDAPSDDVMSAWVDVTDEDEDGVGDTLPVGWEAKKDPATGEVYYHNASQKTVTRSRPQIVSSPSMISSIRKTVSHRDGDIDLSASGESSAYEERMRLSKGEDLYGKASEGNNLHDVVFADPSSLLTSFARQKSSDLQSLVKQSQEHDGTIHESMEESMKRRAEERKSLSKTPPESGTALDSTLRPDKTHKSKRASKHGDGKKRNSKTPPGASLDVPEGLAMDDVTSPRPDIVSQRDVHRYLRRVFQRSANQAAAAAGTKEAQSMLTLPAKGAGNEASRFLSYFGQLNFNYKYMPGHSDVVESSLKVDAKLQQSLRPKPRMKYMTPTMLQKPTPEEVAEKEMKQVMRRVYHKAMKHLCGGPEPQSLISGERPPHRPVALPEAEETMVPKWKPPREFYGGFPPELLNETVKPKSVKKLAPVKKPMKKNCSYLFPPPPSGPAPQSSGMARVKSVPASLATNKLNSTKAVEKAWEPVWTSAQKDRTKASNEKIRLPRVVIPAQTVKA